MKSGRTLQPPADPGHPFWTLKRLIVARTGHHYYDDKDDLLLERVEKRRALAGEADLAAYLARLDSDEHEWSALEAEITIGETFFFRYAEQFSALRDVILPQLIARNLESRRLRIWSAGCSTGAEPYSLAILLSDLLGEAYGDWRVSILGTDINEAFLDVARQGRFGRWALRALDDEQRRRWFDEDGPGRWRLKSRHRSRVRFEKANLLSLLTPEAPLEWSEFDLILCRNVLIYFHHDTVDALVEALGSRLRDGGWLLVGHAEPRPDFARTLQPVSLPGTAAYRRPGEDEDYEPAAPIAPPSAPAFSAAAAPWRPVEPPAAPPTPTPTPGPMRPRAAAKPAAARHDQASNPAPDLAAVLAAADAGDYAQALTLCRHALKAAPQAAELHFHEGVILQAMEHRREAEAAYRRAIYLRRDFIMAHYALGLLLLRDRPQTARKFIATAARIAGTLTAKARLDHGSGLQAGALRDAARLMIES